MSNRKLSKEEKLAKVKRRIASAQKRKNPKRMYALLERALQLDKIARGMDDTREESATETESSLQKPAL